MTTTLPLRKHLSLTWTNTGIGTVWADIVLSGTIKDYAICEYHSSVRTVWFQTQKVVKRKIFIYVGLGGFLVGYWGSRSGSNIGDLGSGISYWDSGTRPQLVRSSSFIKNQAFRNTNSLWISGSEKRKIYKIWFRTFHISKQKRIIIFVFRNVNSSHESRS